MRNILFVSHSALLSGAPQVLYNIASHIGRSVEPQKTPYSYTHFKEENRPAPGLLHLSSFGWY